MTTTIEDIGLDAAEFEKAKDLARAIIQLPGMKDTKMIGVLTAMSMVMAGFVLRAPAKDRPEFLAILDRLLTTSIKSLSVEKPEKEAVH